MYQNQTYSMIQEKKTKLCGDIQRPQNSQTRITQTVKKLPGKTKFTLQDHSARASNTGERKIESLNQDESLSKNIDLSKQRMNKPLKETVLNNVTLKERKIRSASISVHAISSPPTMVKSSSIPFNKISVRETIKSHVPKNMPIDTKGISPPLKPETKRIEECNYTKYDQNKGTLKGNTLKKPNIYPPSNRLKEPKKDSLNGVIYSKKSCASHKPLNRVNSNREEKSHTSVTKNSNRFNKDDSYEKEIFTKERPRSRNVETKNEVNLKNFIPNEKYDNEIIADEQCKIETVIGKLNLVKENVNKINVNCGYERELMSCSGFMKCEGIEISKEDAKHSLIHVHDNEVKMTSEQCKGNADEIDLDQDTEFHYHKEKIEKIEITTSPVADQETFDSLHDRNHDDELLNLDKRIWNDLEEQIRETCDKTDFLCVINDDSNESFSDIIRELHIPQDEDCELITENCNLKENLTRSSTEKSSIELECICLSTKEKLTRYIPVKSKEKYEASQPEKIAHEGSSTLIGKDSESVDNQIREGEICNEEFKSNDSDESKMKIVNQWSEVESNIDPDNEVPDKISIVNSQEEGDNALRSSSYIVNSDFFNTHKNIGFIGKDVDEGCMSFRVEQVALYQPQENQMLLNDLANCLAAQAYLQISGINYELRVRKNAEHMSPSGRVPFISSGLCIIPEFEGIVSFMQYKKFTGVNIEESDKNAFRTIMGLISDTLETGEKYICWYHDETLTNYTKPRVSENYSFPLNHIIHWKKKHEERKLLADRGMSGKSFDNILSEINGCFRTLSRHLGNNCFFFGNTPTEVDALVYGHLYALFTADIDGPLKDIKSIIQRFPNLMSFAVSFDSKFLLNKFPSFRSSVAVNRCYQSV